MHKAIWKICPECEGHGQHSRDFGAITSDEWNGPDWDDDSREAYLSGAYDKPCRKCGGCGKVDETLEKEEQAERDYAYESEYWLRCAEQGVMG